MFGNFKILKVKYIFNFNIFYNKFCEIDEIIIKFFF